MPTSLVSLQQENVKKSEKLMKIVNTLREKCPNTELFLVRIFLYLFRMQENTA